jgi:hypothetical protein
MQAALGPRGGGVGNPVGAAFTNLPALQNLNPQQKQQVRAPSEQWWGPLPMPR